MEKPTGLLKKIIENLQLINSIEGDYSPIEKDIILQHLRSVYMLILNSPTNEHSTRISLSLDTTNNEAMLQQKKIEEVTIKAKEEIVEEVIVEIEDKKEEIVVENTHEIPVSTVSESDHNLAFLAQKKAPITLDLPFEEETKSEKPVKKSLNDLLTEKKEDNSLGSKLQQSKIEDLSKAISINDKFLFIRELFNNKGEEFSASIQKLNECNNLEDAFALMEKLKKYYFWDTTSSAYLSLCDLIRRKYV
jgi:hypothetical protein